MKVLLTFLFLCLTSPTLALECGGVDDTAAVNQAVAAAHTNNSPILLPVGTCKYNDTIVLTEDIDIIGLSERASALSYCGTGDAIRIEVPASVMVRSWLRNFSVRPCVDDGGDNGVDVHLASNSQWAYSGMEHVFIGTFAHEGLRLDNSINNTDGFFNLQFSQSVILNGVEGIRIGDSVAFLHTVIAGRNKVKLSQVTSAGMFQFIGGQITTNGGFMDLTDFSNARIEDVFMEYPLAMGPVTTSFNGVVLYGGGSNQFIGNVFNGSGTYGHMFAMIGSPNNQIQRDSFFGTPAYAHIYGTLTSTGTIMRDNNTNGVTPAIVCPGC